MMRTMLLVSCLVAPLPAAAQTMVDATEPAEVMNIARGWGSALLETDEAGDPMIRGRIEGIAYIIYFYGCTEGRDCNNIQLRASWLLEGVDMERMNTWNRERRFGKAYLDADGNPSIEMTLNLAFGVTARNLDDTFGWWAAILPQFFDHITNAEGPAELPEDSHLAPVPLEGVTDPLVSRPQNATR